MEGNIRRRILEESIRWGFKSNEENELADRRSRERKSSRAHSWSSSLIPLQSLDSKRWKDSKLEIHSKKKRHSGHVQASSMQKHKKLPRQFIHRSIGWFRTFEGIWNFQSYATYEGTFEDMKLQNVSNFERLVKSVQRKASK